MPVAGSTPTYMRVWQLMPFIWPVAAAIAVVSWRRWPAVAYAICLLGCAFGLMLLVGGGRPIRQHLPNSPPAPAWRLVGIASTVMWATLTALIWERFSSRGASLATAVPGALAAVISAVVLNRRYRQYSFFLPRSLPQRR